MDALKLLESEEFGRKLEMFDIIIDKATSDAFLCSDETSMSTPDMYACVCVCVCV